MLKGGSVGLVRSIKGVAVGVETDGGGVVFGKVKLNGSNKRGVCGLLGIVEGSGFVIGTVGGVTEKNGRKGVAVGRRGVMFGTIGGIVTGTVGGLVG